MSAVGPPSSAATEANSVTPDLDPATQGFRRHAFDRGNRRHRADVGGIHRRLRGRPRPIRRSGAVEVRSPAARRPRQSQPSACRDRGGPRLEGELDRGVQRLFGLPKRRATGRIGARARRIDQVRLLGVRDHFEPGGPLEQRAFCIHLRRSRSARATISSAGVSRGTPMPHRTGRGGGGAPERRGSVGRIEGSSTSVGGSGVSCSAGASGAEGTAPARRSRSAADSPSLTACSRSRSRSPTVSPPRVTRAEPDQALKGVELAVALGSVCGGELGIIRSAGRGVAQEGLADRGDLVEAGIDRCACSSDSGSPTTRLVAAGRAADSRADRSAPGSTPSIAAHRPPSFHLPAPSLSNLRSGGTGGSPTSAPFRRWLRAAGGRATSATRPFPTPDTFYIIGSGATGVLSVSRSAERDDTPPLDRPADGFGGDRRGRLLGREESPQIAGEDLFLRIRRMGSWISPFVPMATILAVGFAVVPRDQRDGWASSVSRLRVGRCSWFTWDSA